MPCTLRREEIVTLQVLLEKGVPNTEIARQLGVTEGTVRYHQKKQEEAKMDGRGSKPAKAKGVAHLIEHWLQEHTDPRSANIKALYEYLLEYHQYEGSYKSVLRYVRTHYPPPPLRTYRRVETPPGAQSQSDWGEFSQIDLGRGPQKMHAFVMVLSHSRQTAVIWSEGEGQLDWLHCHNEAYRRLGGIAAVNRIDNLKTAIAQGAGAWGEINKTYRAYARAVGFHIDACRPRQAQEKGKVEAKVRLSRLQVDPGQQRFEGMEPLQSWTDGRLLRWSQGATCPPTGATVWDTWQQERNYLAPLPILPEPFDVVVTRSVSTDSLVSFEGRQYCVPFVHAGQRVEVRGCARTVQILAEGRVVREYPRGTKERLLLDKSCYEGPGNERVLAPPPLGKMSSALQEIWDMPVEQRPLDLYQALAEVARR